MRIVRIACTPSVVWPSFRAKIDVRVNSCVCCSSSPAMLSMMPCKASDGSMSRNGALSTLRDDQRSRRLCIAASKFANPPAQKYRHSFAASETSSSIRIRIIVIFIASDDSAPPRMAFRSKCARERLVSWTAQPTSFLSSAESAECKLWLNAAALDVPCARVSAVGKFHWPARQAASNCTSLSSGEANSSSPNALEYDLSK
mmetsp:Transcript_3846/g.13889  ORF Transcript_3846/g.13889 Transcript_3846/m.13889 type:complete len:201 (+) Transcript_3846:2707-3309(+)